MATVTTTPHKKVTSSSGPTQKCETDGKPHMQGNSPATLEPEFPLDSKSVTLSKRGLTEVPSRYVCLCVYNLSLK